MDYEAQKEGHTKTQSEAGREAVYPLFQSAATEKAWKLKNS
jgi:hypothetical protein